MLIVLPPLSYFDLLPLSLAHSLSLGIVFAWIVGGAACGLLSLIAGFALHQLTVSRAEFEKLSRTDMKLPGTRLSSIIEPIRKAMAQSSVV